jgi:tetratricopeptide (TPR) repeat protein
MLASPSVGAQNAPQPATFESVDNPSLALLERAKRALNSSDLQAARTSFSAAVAAFEANPAHPLALVDALSGLAQTLNGLHEYEAAIPHARRALLLIRSRNGLYAPEQRPILALLIDGQSQIGLVEEASADLRLLERMSASAQAPDPLRHAITLTEAGDWHCRLGNFFDGRDRHRRAIEALEHANAETALLNAHLGLARCSLHELSSQGIRTAGSVFEEYRGQILRAGTYSVNAGSYRYHVGRGLRGEAEDSVREAARIASASTTLAVRAKADTLLFAGDWFQLKGFTNAARKYYADAAKVLGSATNPDDRLETPVRVLYAIPPLALRAYGRAPPKRSERFIVVEFTVRADGSVQTPKVIERNVTKSMVDETLDALRAARYRPRVIDGRPVESRVVMRQSFDDPRELSTIAYSNEE